MPWPWIWSSKTENDNSTASHSFSKQLNDIVQQATSQEAIANDSNAPFTTWQWHAYTQPQTILATAVLTTACLAGFQLYRIYLRRIPEAINIHQSHFRQRSIFGRVTSVGDGDNFRVYHTPGGRLAGWGWLPGRKVPNDKKLLKNKTIHIRIAGIDAPEASHFGRPAQPFSAEALDWLTSYLSGRRVRAYVYKIDQYSRVVATVYVRKGIFRRDVGLQMLRAGLATVYEAKTGAEFGEGREKKYRNAEWWAKTKRKGMWAGSRKDYESPREYKSRYGGGTP